MTLCFLTWLLGCAAHTPPAAMPESPAWTTEEGLHRSRVTLVEALLDAHQPEAALQVIREMQSAGADAAELDILQARALRSIGLHEDAEHMLLAAQARQRRNPEIHNQLGILYMDRQHPDVAVAHFQKAFQLDSENPEFANNLGFSLMSARRPAEAVEVLRTALQLDPTRTRTRYNLAFALIANNQSDEAYRIFRSSSTEDDAQYNLGVGLELSGAPNDAMAAYTAALTANPNHALAQAALIRLSSPSPPEEPTP